MKQVQVDSQGKVNMGPGTLYGSLTRMIEAGLIREIDKKTDPEMDDERRVYYKLTGPGKKRSLRNWSDTTRSWRSPSTKRDFTERFCIWPINTRYDDTGVCTQNCFASTRSRSTSASARAWSRPSTTFCGGAQKKKEDYSLKLSGCSSKHPPESSGRT